MLSFIHFLNEEFDVLVEQYLSEDIVAKAKELALHFHGDQKYGTKPYSYHLTKVVDVLKRFHQLTPELLAAGWLHDTIEDTDATIEDLKKHFPTTTIQAVQAVTNEPEDEATYRNIVRNHDAIKLKLADRIANVEEGDKIAKYKKKYPMFRHIIYKPGVADVMWTHLDKLMDWEH